MDRLSRINELLGNIRSLQQSNRAAVLPLTLSDVSHQPVNPLHFEVGKWTDTPWEGVKCFGISLTENEVVIICEVIKPLRMGQQEHGPWAERLVMESGELYEHTTEQTYRPGKGVYFQPAGVVHDPEFKTPSRCMITWTRN